MIACAPSQPSGHAIFIGGGGLQVGWGPPGVVGFGHSTRCIAVQVAPDFITVQRCSYATVCGGVGGGGFATTTGSAGAGGGVTCDGGDCGALHAVASVMTNGFAKILRGARAIARAYTCFIAAGARFTSSPGTAAIFSWNHLPFASTCTTPPIAIASTSPFDAIAVFRNGRFR